MEVKKRRFWRQASHLPGACFPLPWIRKCVDGILKAIELGKPMARQKTMWTTKKITAWLKFSLGVFGFFPLLCKNDDIALTSWEFTMWDLATFPMACLALCPTCRRGESRFLRNDHLHLQWRESWKRYINPDLNVSSWPLRNTVGVF